MDTYDFLADPRTLTIAERLEARDRLAVEQHRWLTRLRDLAEDPKPQEDFPAFLLATPPFHELAQSLTQAESHKDLGTEVADELEWFVRVFADYLRTRDGEEVFPEPPRLTA